MPPNFECGRQCFSVHLSTAGRFISSESFDRNYVVPASGEVCDIWWLPGERFFRNIETSRVGRFIRLVLTEAVTGRHVPERLVYYLKDPENIAKLYAWQAWGRLPGVVLNQGGDE